MPHRVEMWRTLRWVSIVVLLLIGAYFLVVRPLQQAVSGTTVQISKGLDKVLAAVTNSDTRIVEGRAELTERSEIAELGLAELKMNATRTFENEGYLLKYLPSGTKKLIVRGHYQVKAGYKLVPGVSLRAEKGRVIARFPRPQVLSVELLDFQVLNEENGWLNKVTPEDRATVLRELREQMRIEAERSGLLDTVEQRLRTRLKDLLGSDQVTVEEQNL